MNISTKPKDTTTILCIFLGWVGAHRFYVGKKVPGAVQAGLSGFGWILSLSGLEEPGSLVLLAVLAWVIADLVMILTGRFTDSEGAVIAGKTAPAGSGAAGAAAPDDLARLQQRILIAAKQGGGVITPTTVAIQTGFTIDAIKEHLESLVDKGYAEVQPSKDGAMVYVFRELLSEEKRREFELV